MTRKQGPRAAARALLPKWQRRLRISDWYISVSDLEPEDGQRSVVDVDARIRQAAIRLRGDTPASQVERQLVHELLHVRIALAESAYILAKEHTPPAFDKPNTTMWDLGVEAAIEALADALGCVPRTEWGPSGPVWNAAFPSPEAFP